MQKPEQQSEEKKEESNNANLKSEQKESKKNSCIPGTSGEGSEIVKMSVNEQQTAKGNSEDGNKRQQSVVDNRDERVKHEEPNTRRSTRSITANSKSNKVSFLNTIRLVNVTYIIA